jgi:hypothetical protein
MKSVRRILTGLAAVLWISGCTTTVTRTPSIPATPFRPLPSQTIFSVRHLADSGDLTVILKTGEVLEFLGVPASVVEEWRSSADPDAFFQERILGVKRSEPKVEAPAPEAVAPQPETVAPEAGAGTEEKGPS